jgi:hypothetical protein
MSYAFQDRKNMFESCYIHVWQNKIQWFKYLNHVTSMFDKQDTMIQLFESCYIPVWSNCRNSLKLMSTINCDCPLNIEHYDHTSVEEFQSRQWPWVSFPNPPLLCLLLCARAPHSFCFQAEEDGQGWWDWRGQVWGSVDQVGVSHGSRQPSLRFQALPTVCYLQGWMPRGLDQVGDGLLWDWEPDAHEGTCRQDQDVSDFVEGSSLILLWTSSHEEVGDRRLRSPRQWTHRTSP